MTTSKKTESRSYQSIYEGFDSPLMSRLRSEAYGEDIGQHSWVTADDLRRDVTRIKVSDGNRILDLGCGPCGPLTFLMKATGCSGYGLDLSEAALAAGQRRAASLAVADRLEVQRADLDSDLALAPCSFDAAISFDVVLHLRDRLRVFREIALALVPGGRFLFTDAAVVSGCVSSEEVATRSTHGFVQFCASGYNESTLMRAGFKLLETEDRTATLLSNARGRLEARMRYGAELRHSEGDAGFAGYQAYLHSIIAMSERAALSRIMYLAEARAD
jgi:SAM-dependent methyltransferase